MFTIRFPARFPMARFALVLSLFAAACSDDDEPGATPTPPAATTDGGTAPPPSTSDAGSDAAVAAFPAASAAELQKVLDDVVTANVAPGVAAAVSHPRYAPWAGASGTANVATSEPMTATHRFRAGSILKTSVATATLQLVEKKKLALEDTLTALLPEAVTAKIPNAAAITVRMLLNHTSGIAEYSDEAFDAKVVADPLHQWTLDELLAIVAEKPATSAPGGSWSYSNTNYTLLGEILTSKGGEPWRAIVTKNVLARAKVGSSALPNVGDVSCTGCAHGYEPGESGPIDVTTVDPSMAGAAGGSALVTTTADLATLLGALHRGKLFDDPATLAAMTTIVDAPVPEEAQVGYGLGLTKFKVGEEVFYGHLGGTAGYQSFVLVHDATGLVTSGFMNRRGDLGALILPVLEAASRIP